MGRFPRLCGLLLIAGCAKGESGTEPCVRTINVLDAPSIIVNTNTTLHATLKAENCAGTEPVTWTSSNTATAEILAATDSTASVRGKAPGSPTIVAFLTRIPAVRDSIVLTVTPPVDANRPDSQ